jgi:VWFA-related protein
MPTRIALSRSLTALISLVVVGAAFAAPSRSVRAVVSGPDHAPVPDLSAKDFAVTVDGKPVPVSSAVAAASPAPRRVLFVFDLTSLSAADAARAREAAKAFAAATLAPGDLGAVATYSADGLEFELNFTPDRSQVALVCAGAAASPSSDPLLLVKRLDGAPDAGAAAKAPDAAPAGGTREQRLAKFLQSAARLARALDAVSGRKDVVYFSSGFDLKLLSGRARTRELLQKISEQTSQATNEAVEEVASDASVSLDSQTAGSESTLESGWKALIELFKKSGCAVDAVDMAAGKASDAATAMSQIADGTHGTLFHGIDDFQKRGAEAIPHGGQEYILAIGTDGEAAAGSYHALSVAVSRPGDSVESREGFFVARPFAKQSPLERNFAAADAVTSGTPRNALSPHLLTAAFAAKGMAVVPVLLKMDGGAIQSLPSNSPGVLPLDLFGYAIADGGRIGDYFSQKVTLDLAQVRDKIARDGLLDYVPLRLAPGAYEIRVAVRNETDGALGVSSERVLVPDFSSGTPVLSPPIFAGSRPEGVVVHDVSARAAGEAPPDFPYVAGNEVLYPEVPGQLVAGGQARVCLYSYNLGGGDEKAGIGLAGQILSSEGRPVGTAALSLTGRSRPDELGRTTYVLSFSAPGLAAGSYDLRVILQNAATGQARQSIAAFEVK